MPKRTYTEMIKTLLDSIDAEIDNHITPRINALRDQLSIYSLLPSTTTFSDSSTLLTPSSDSSTLVTPSSPNTQTISAELQTLRKCHTEQKRRFAVVCRDWCYNLDKRNKSKSLLNVFKKDSIDSSKLDLHERIKTVKDKLAAVKSAIEELQLRIEN